MVTRVELKQGLNRAAAYSKQKAKIAHKKGNDFWKYAKPAYKATTQLITIYSIKVYKGAEEFAEETKKLDKLIARINFLAIVTLYYETTKLPEKIKECYEALHVRKDFEGFVFAFLDLLETMGTITKSVEDLLAALQTLFDKAGINILEEIILPITIVCGAYGTVRDWYNWGHQVYQWQSMPSQIKTKKDLKKLVEYLEKKLNNQNSAWYDPEKIFKPLIKNYDSYIEKDTVKNRISLRNRVRLEKRTDERIVNIMRNLQEHLSNNKKDIDKANKAVLDMNTLMRRKITVGFSENLVSSALTAASIASLIFALAPLTFPILLASKHLTVLSKQIYMCNFYDKGLNLPDLAKAPS